MILWREHLSGRFDRTAKLWSFDVAGLAKGGDDSDITFLSTILSFLIILFEELAVDTLKSLIFPFLYISYGGA